MRITLLVFGFVLASACSSGSKSACVSGQSISCTGPGGCSGGQACKQDGSGYEACDCSGAPNDAGSQTPDSGNAVPDAGPQFCTPGQGADSDHDGVVDSCDNCPSMSNADQHDLDCDGIGDVCDPDEDGDGVPNTSDNCPKTPNPNQARTNMAQPLGDLCNDDDDGDGVKDGQDNCPLVANPDQGLVPTGAVCNTDLDSDGVADDRDNCPTVANPNQADANSNGIGDACECGSAVRDAGH